MTSNFQLPISHTINITTDDTYDIDLEPHHLACNMAPKDEEGPYHAKDAISGAVACGLIVGSAGVLAAAVQVALQPQNIGVWGIVKRTGSTAGLFAAVGGVYQFSAYAAANLRQKDDHWNTAIGGFLAGAIAGLPTGRMPRVLGSGAFMAVTIAAFEYTGGRLNGFREDPQMDEFERKEGLRKNRRRPLEETLAEVGEGRSIRPPGYEERRRERLKEKYGIHINPISADPDA